MPQRAFSYRIYPTEAEAERLESWAGATRFVYNAALEQRRDWWRQFRRANGRGISWVSQGQELTAARREFPWLAEVPRSAAEYALLDLERAFAAFYSGSGFPRFRSRDRNTGFRLQWRYCRAERLNRKWARLSLSKGLTVKLRVTRDFPSKIIAVTIKRDAMGWAAVLQCDVEALTGSGEQEVGIDRGVAATLSLSNGEAYNLPASIAARHRARASAQRVLTHRTIGSRRRNKQKALVARHYAAAAASRKHWLHERSTDIAKRFRSVVLEKLKTANMTRRSRGKSGLNRVILEQGWATFAEMLEYKLADRGGQLVYVSPVNTSQTCPSCGSVDALSRKSQAVFECVDCGHADNADVNAAINILRRSPACVEGAGYSPVEARTGEVRKHLENLAA